MNGTARRRRFWKRMIWVSAIVTAALPLSGIVGTIVGMTRAFSRLRDVGSADPSALAGDISIALLTTLWAIILSLPALIFLIVSLIRYRHSGRDLQTSDPSSTTIPSL